MQRPRRRVERICVQDRGLDRVDAGVDVRREMSRDETFYAFDKATRTKKAVDLSTGEYRASVKPASLPRAAEKDLAALVAAPGKVGAYAWEILGKVLAYAAMLVGEAADVDQAVAVIGEQRPDVVLLDLGLPVRLEESPDLPVPARCAAVASGAVLAAPIERVMSKESR